MIDTTLLALDQFISEVRSLPMYSDEQQLHFAALARQGDKQACHTLIESLIPVVIHYAKSFAWWCKHLSLLDIVQFGNESLVLHVDRALDQAACPPQAFLLTTARRDMLRYCRRYDHPIVTPQGSEPYSVASLDVPINEDETSTLADLLPAPARSEDRDCAALDAALSQLSEDRRVLLARRYGLLGYAPTAPFDLARELLPDLPDRQAYTILHNREKRALLALQVLMAASYLPEIQRTPDAFYTAAEIKQRFGITPDQLCYWAQQGRIARYPVPPTVKSSHVPFVYDTAEIDGLAASWQPRKKQGASTLDARRDPLEARRSTLDTRRSMRAAGEEVA